MELAVIFVVSLLIGGGIAKFTPNKGVAPRTAGSFGTVDLRSASPISGFYEVSGMDGAPSAMLAPATGLYQIGTSGPAVERTTYIAAIAASGARSTKRVVVAEGRTTVVDFGTIAPVTVTVHPTAEKPLPVAPTQLTVASGVQVKGMPWGGRVKVNGTAVNGRWTDEPAKTLWRVDAPAGRVSLDVTDATGVTRTGTADVPLGGFVLIEYASMNLPNAVRASVENNAISNAALMPRGGVSIYTPISEETHVPVIFMANILASGITLTTRFTVTFQYQPGTYFRRDVNGVWDRAFRLAVRRGPKADGIESATVFTVGDAKGTDPRMSRSAYDAREPFAQVAYRNNVEERAYLSDDNSRSQPASLFAEPSLPIGTKASQTATFVVESGNGRISITNSRGNGGIEETIGVRRVTSSFFMGIETPAAPNTFAITRPPAAGEESADYVSIGLGETKEFSLNASGAASSIPFLGGLFNVALDAGRKVVSTAKTPSAKTRSGEVALFTGLNDNLTQRFGSGT